MNPYLSEVEAAMGADPFAAGAAASGITPQGMVPAGPVQGAPGQPPFVPLSPAAVQAANEMAAAGVPPSDGASVDVGPSIQEPVAAPDVPAAPALSLASTGAYTPAHEVSRLGPTQLAAQEAGIKEQNRAIGTIAERQQQQALADEALYFKHAEDARRREEAALQVSILRDQEMKARADDFDKQAKALSAEKLDPGRFWATKSAPQKIATFVSIALGGFLAGARGGENMAMKQVNEEIERDIKAQETSFHIKRAGLDASQTAYGQAVQRYNSTDAARSFARAAALDSVAAEIQRQQAQNKGVESQNRADAALAELAQQRAQQIQQGIAFVQPSATGPTYNVANRLGPQTAAQVNAQIAAEEERGFKLSEIDRKAQGEAGKDSAKGAADREKRWVPTSSTGKGYYAPTEKEGSEHREVQASTQEVLDLVDRINTNSASLGYTGRVSDALASKVGLKSTSARKVQTDSVALIGALNRMNKFGALDKGTQDILDKMIGDPTSVMGNSTELSTIRANAIEKRRQIEKSSTGSKPSAVPEGSQTGATGKQAW